MNGRQDLFKTILLTIKSYVAIYKARQASKN